MSTRVESLTVKNLSNILMEVEDWYQLGVNLDMKTFKLTEIKHSRGPSLASCRIALIDLWLRCDVDASWEKLVMALEQMGEDGVVKKIKQTFIQTGGGGGAPRTGPARTGPQHATTAHQVQVPYAGAGRVRPDGSNSIRQPVVGAADNPEDEIRHAQRLIDDVDMDGRLLEMISKLSDWNFDVDYCDPNDSGNTLLHYSCFHGDLSAVQAMVAFGSDVNIRNIAGLTPVDAAKLLRKDDIVRFLREVGGVEANILHMVNVMPSSAPIQCQDPALRGESDDHMRDEGPRDGHLILSLDYSSTMALVQLEVLNQLEKTMGKRIVDMFEWIVASGVGGFLMMAMVYGEKSISELRRIYFRLRERVFCGQAPEERGKELEAYAIEVFGDARRMEDVRPNAPKLLIGAVNKSATNLNSIFFNNYQGEYSRVHLWKVARYTCSSPLYIGECDNYIDGGAVYRNPSIFAFSVIRESYHMQSVPLDAVVSIGSGRMPGVGLSKLDSSNYYSHFLLSTANTLSEELSQCFSGICEAGHMWYQRLNPLLDEYLYVPEEAKLEQLVNAVIRTIVQCRHEDSDVQGLKRKYNNFGQF